MASNRKRSRSAAAAAEHGGDGVAQAVQVQAERHSPPAPPSIRSLHNTAQAADSTAAPGREHPEDHAEDQGNSEQHTGEEPGAQGVHATGHSSGPPSPSPAPLPDEPRKHKKLKVLPEDRLRRLKQEYDRRGVVYVSRIPPHMKPTKLKQLLSQHGETLRVYCTPEDPRTRKLRKKKGGNTGKNFTEGWVEFADKRVAKRVAIALNGQRIGGRRRSAYYDDLWTLKYLKHFKWEHLTEEIAYQKAVREQRLAAELSAAKKERDAFLAHVDAAKALAAMAERRAAKAAATAAEAGTGTAGARGTPAAEPPAQAGQPSGGSSPAVPKLNRGLSLRAPLRIDGGSQRGHGAAPRKGLADDVLLMVARSKKAARRDDSAA